MVSVRFTAGLPTDGLTRRVDIADHRPCFSRPVQSDFSRYRVGGPQARRSRPDGVFKVIMLSATSAAGRFTAGRTRWIAAPFQVTRITFFPAFSR